jgi:hypothetical protein
LQSGLLLYPEKKVEILYGLARRAFAEIVQATDNHQAASR